jgi:hypothetical protein
MHAHCVQELIEQHSMVKQLLEVNRARSAEESDMALQIPFVIVRVRIRALPQCPSSCMRAWR